MAAATENLAKRLAAGQFHRVKLYDKIASQQQLGQQRGSERAGLVRS